MSDDPFCDNRGGPLICGRWKDGVQIDGLPAMSEDGVEGLVVERVIEVCCK